MEAQRSNYKNGREIYVEIEKDGVISSVTSNVVNVLGYNQQYMIGKKLKDFTNGDIGFDFQDPKRYKKRTCITFNRSDKEIVHMDLQPLMGSHGDSGKMTISMIDVTEYVQQEEKHKRILRIFEKSNDIIYSLDLNPEPSYVYLSPAIKKVLGYTLEENKENPLLACDIVHHDYYDIQMKKAKGEIDNNEILVTRYKHKNTGEYIWFEDQCTPIYNNSKELIGIDGICRNIHDRKELEEKLRYLSYHDALTGLYNKAYLEEKLKNLNTKKGAKVGMIVCDLNNLKYINDKLGHYEGDKLIKGIGEVIADSFNKQSISSRFGGDEFVIVLEGVGHEELQRAIENFKDNIVKYNEKNRTLPIEISIGFSYTEHLNGNVNEIFKQADKNMFKEKAQTKIVTVNRRVGK